MSTPILSIGMIVKDEIRCIERCLKSLEGLRKELPCEVVIADTGSTDGTREIIEKYADIVFDFEWCNDFAAARNAVLDRCTGVWHLQLDADEWLCDDCKELIHFCKNPKCRNYNTAAIRIRNYFSENIGEPYNDFTTERIFQIKSGFRFVGKVHEVPKPVGKNAKPKRSILLQQFFLHHDGYIATIKKQKQKNKRNMDILLPMLEKEPNDLRLLCECIESTDAPSDQLPYVEKGLEIIKKNEGKNLNFAPSMARHVVITYATAGKTKEAEEAWEFVKEKYKESIYIKLDAAGIMTLLYHSMKNFEKALEIGMEWCKEQQIYEKSENSELFNILGPLTVMSNDVYESVFESLCGLERWEEAEQMLDSICLKQLNNSRKTSFITIFVTQVPHFVNHIEWFENEMIENEPTMKPADVYEVIFKSLCGAQKWEDAQTVLHKIEPVELSTKNLASFINTFIDSDSYFSNPLQELQRVVIEPEEDFYKSDNPVSWAQYSRALRAKMEEHFENEGALSPVIAQLETDIGYSARALREYDMQQMLLYAEKIENWENAMSQLYVRIMEQHLLFPAKFYQSDSEVWGNMASILSTLPEITSVFLSYAQSVPAITTEQLSWYSNIAAVLLAKGRWDTNEQAVELCKCFAQVEHELAETMYSPKMFTPECLHLLPSGHRFGWYLKQAMEAIQTNHLAECIPILRAALKTAPVYNKVLYVLLDYVSSQNASPELLALAEKIRGILAQYSPDDPAVQEIKQSPAYQKVAYLIDGVTSPVVGGLLQ